ncbi:MAG: hypothetical protein A4E65_00177 [Syntrophorhabdus sp. PtaU1.Bin153]|nr:MAG: hypothetical protein A4E65_00177 [Syntrophorhabdus sp. PtaU1.Bin153]
MTGTYVGIIGWRQWSDSSGGPATELAFGDEGIAFRQGATTTWGSWLRLIHSGNYNSYAPTLTGTGASGTWGIAITGNAATATKLATTRALTIGGTAKNFDGSAAVSWSLAEIGALGASAKAADSSLLNGVSDSESNTASTIAKRNSSGDIVARLFRSTYANQSTISGAIAFRIDTTDNYIRFCSDAAAIRTFLSAQKTITRGTAAPSGGSDGDIYIQYTA